MQKDTKIQITVETSASTKALQDYKAGLEQAIGAARLQGLSSAAMEKELAGVNHQLANSKLKDYRAALEQAAAAARKAGKDTSDLDRQLKALDSAKPTTGLQKLKGALQQAAGQIPGMSAFTSFFNGSGRAVAAWAGIILSTGIGALLALVNGMKTVVSTGVQFNSTLENAQLGVAAVLKQFDDTGKFASFEDAMAASAEAIDMLKSKALESPAGFEQLVQAYQGTAGVMTSSGMDIQQQINTIVTMSQTLAGLGIRNEQILQETRAILTGNITEDAAAARILGITREMIMTAKEEGNLYEFLQSRMSSFAEAGVRSADTLTTKTSNLYDSFQQLSGQLSKPFFDGLKNSADTAQRALNFLQRTVNRISPPPKAAADGVEDIGKKARAAELEIRTLNNARVDALKKSAESAGEAFDKMAGKIRAAAKEADDLDESETGRALAQVDLDEQKAMAAAGNDPAAQEAARSDASARRRAIQSAREGRRSTRSQDAERQIAEEIESQMSERGAEAARTAAEADRARSGTRAAKQSASAAGIDVESLTAEARNKLTTSLSSQAKEIQRFLDQSNSSSRNYNVDSGNKALEEIAGRAKWTGVIDTSAASAELSRVGDLLKSLQAVNEAINYEAQAQANAQSAGDALESYKDVAEPKLNQARANLEKLQIEEQTAKIKEQAEAEKVAADAKRKADEEHIAALERELALQEEINRTEQDRLNTQGATEEEQTAARIAGQEKVRAMELEIAKIRGGAEDLAARQEQERIRESLAQQSPAAATTSGRQSAATSPTTAAAGGQAIAPETRGRPSAPLQTNPIGGAINAPVDLFAPARPQGINTMPQAQSPTQPPGGAGGPGGGAGGTQEIRSALQDSFDQLQAELSGIAGDLPGMAEPVLTKIREVRSEVAKLKAQVANIKAA